VPVCGVFLLVSFEKETEDDPDEEDEELSSSGGLFSCSGECVFFSVLFAIDCLSFGFSSEFIAESRKALCSSTERAAKAANMSGFALSVKVDSAVMAVAASIGTSTASDANKRRPWASLIAAKSLVVTDWLSLK